LAAERPQLRSTAAYGIAISYAAVSVWMILLIGVIAYLFANADFQRERDLRITRQLDQLSAIGNRPTLLREIDRAENDGFTIALFDAAGKRVAGSLILRPPPPGLIDVHRQGLRVGSVQLRDSSRLAVGAGDEGFAPVRRLLLLTGLAALAALIPITALGGWAIKSYLRRRLKPISATAEAIVTGDIEWRVPVRPDGDEFDAAGRAFNLMLDRISSLMENLRQVSSDIAHDLRKPLIRLLCQADRLGEIEGAEQRVIELGDELLMLFSGILRIAEVEGGGLERSFERIDLSHLMSEVAESFAPALIDADDTFDWTIEPGIAVLGNRELLAQIAANLLDNARIHTPPGTAVKLGLAGEGDTAMFWVEDNGPGVLDDQIDKLTQRFFRADASRNTVGNGLGLSLVAAAVGAHGGTVSIRNALPGLRIAISLPRLDGDAAAQWPI
jgi:signal transduction histidine kinase